VSDSPHCMRCGKTPSKIAEYAFPAKDFGISRDEYVRREEGTYNPDNNLFACTDCYTELGCPSSPTRRGWRAGDPIVGTLR